jgi:acyl carrier protein
MNKEIDRQIIKNKLKEILNQQDNSNFDDNIQLADLDIDSLEVVELIIKIEKEYNIQLPDKFLPKNIKDFIDGIIFHLKK